MATHACASVHGASGPAAFVVVAHRGDQSAAPENTFAAFDAALAAGFSHCETDVQLSKDGVAVILHDEKLGRVNDGVGEACSTDWATLQRLDVGSWFDPAFASCRMPTLESMLQRYSGRMHLHLELKSSQPELPKTVAAALLASDWLPLPAASSPMEHAKGAQPTNGGSGSPAALHFGPVGLTITSFHLTQLQASLLVLPAVRHGWLVHELTADVLQQAVAAGLHQICPRANVCTAEGVAAAVAQGLSVRCWGIKTPEMLLQMRDIGAHGATVNWPAKARAALLLQASSSPLL